MLAFGALLTCAGVLALTALMRALAGPNPPRWMTGHWAQELATVVIVCALSFGPASIAAGAMRTYEAGPNFLDLGLLGAVLVAAVWTWRRLNVLKPTRALAATRADFVPPAATEPPPPRPSKPTRRAA